jgi:hypothetical protein
MIAKVARQQSEQRNSWGLDIQSAAAIFEQKRSQKDFHSVDELLPLRFLASWRLYSNRKGRKEALSRFLR